MVMFGSRSVITSFAGALGLCVVYKLFIEKYFLQDESDDSSKTEEQVTQQKKVQNQSFVLSFDQEKCRNHLLMKTACEKESCSYKALLFILNFIEETNATLDICSLLMTLSAISDAIIDAKKRGIRVRIICDHYFATEKGAQLPKLVKCGIPVRSRAANQPGTTHSKFMIGDGIRCLFGSANWTLQALCGNCEHMIVTDEEEITAQFCSAFNAYWNELSGVVL